MAPRPSPPIQTSWAPRNRGPVLELLLSDIAATGEPEIVVMTGDLTEPRNEPRNEPRCEAGIPTRRRPPLPPDNSPWP